LSLSRFLASAAFLSFAAFPAFSQPAEVEAEVVSNVQADDDEAIIITGARTQLPATALPMTVDVLGGQALDDQVAVSGSVIDAVSARLPAFSPTREKLSGSGESLRGRSPLYAINGVPQSTPIRDGSRDGFTIDPFFIDRVEVIYGSNALQGIGATGGVVNQVTVGAPSEDGVSGLALIQGTAQDGFGGEALGGKIAGLVGYRAGALDLTGGATFERRGAFLDGDGRRIGTDGTQGDIQDSDSWSLFGRFGYQLSPTARIELIANRFELEGRGHYVTVNGNRVTDQTTTSERGDPQGVPAANRAELLSASFTESDLGGGLLSAQAFFSRTRDIFGGSITGTFQDAAIAPIGTLFDQSVNNSRKMGGKLSYERTVPGFDALTVIGGVDVLTDRTAQSLLATGRDWVPPSDFTSISPFLQGNLKLLDGKLRLAGGLRYERVKLSVDDFTTLASYGSRGVAGGKPTFEKLLGNAGIVVEPVRGLRAYASYAEGYTIADVGRILRAINVDGVDVDTFLSLEPVVSNNRELGVEWKRGALTASAAYWWSSSKLGSLLVRNSDGIFDVVRAPIELQGLELSADWKTPIAGLAIGGAYARTRGRTDANQDDDLDTDLDGSNIAPDRVNLYASYARGSFDARLAARFYLEREFDLIAVEPGTPAQIATQDANAFEGYTLLDASVAYRFGKNRVSLSAMNLTDERYITYFSDTRPATGSNTSDTTYFAGRGRTFTLGLTREF
jgi:iron complex outermembrane receptor protein